MSIMDKLKKNSKSDFTSVLADSKFFNEQYKLYEKIRVHIESELMDNGNIKL